jgi:hypothetical protein
MSLISALALTAGAAWAQPPSDWAREHLGVYLWPTYPRLGGYTLPELAAATEELGPRVVRLTLEANFGREASWVDVARSPAVTDCLARWPTVLLTLSDHSGRQYEPDWTRARYDELTAYLLDAYRSSGKTFVLGLWESDHWLPLDERGLTFLQARQAGIEAARERAGDTGVRVFTMVEVTRSQGDCVATKLLPQAPPEVVSLSWWAEADDVGAALGRLRALLPQATLMVGEMGLSDRRDPQRTAKLLAAIEDARRAGAEWVVLWRLDDWEYGLIEAKPEGGARTDLWSPVWALLHRGEAYDPAAWRPTGEAEFEGGRVPIELPEGQGLRSLCIATHTGSGPVTVAAGDEERRLAASLPPQSELCLDDSGAGMLRIGPIHADAPERWAPWQPAGLNWNSEFAVWQPAARGQEGWLELTLETDYPILGGSLWLTGRRPKEGAWGMRVRGYEEEWLECPLTYDWRGEQLLAEFPALYPSEWGPTRRGALRFYLRTDDPSDNWVWSAGLTSARVTLELDTRAVHWPSARALTLAASGADDACWRLTAGPGGQD